MWVRGTDDDGYVLESTRTQFFDNIDQLTKIFQPGDGLLEVIHTLPDGSQRRAWAECTEAIDFSVQDNSGGQPLGKFSVALKMPSPFWEERTVTEIQLPIPANQQLDQLSGTTAPIEDALILVTGPVTNFRIEALLGEASLENPTWLQYNGTIAAGKVLRIDCGTWTLTGVGMTADYSLLQHEGSSYWMALMPGRPGDDPAVKVTGSNVTSASKVTLQLRRKFLVG
ncbi:hypothetical protein ACWIG4_30110 [Streptomyces sp. NPDC002248]